MKGGGKVGAAVMRLQRRLHVRVLLCGMLLAYVAFVAQTTSRFTPYIAQYPPLFDLVGRLGTALLVIAALVCLRAYFASLQAYYLVFACLYGFAAMFTVASVWGQAFQLGIAGLTIGVSLFLFGCFDPNLRIKKQ